MGSEDNGGWLLLLQKKKSCVQQHHVSASQATDWCVRIETVFMLEVVV